MTENIAKTIGFIKSVCITDTLYHETFSLRFNRENYFRKSRYSSFLKLIEFTNKLTILGKILFYAIIILPYTIWIGFWDTIGQTVMTLIILSGGILYILYELFIHLLKYLFIKKTEELP